MTLDNLRREAGMALAALKTNLETLGKADPLLLIHWPMNPAVRRTAVQGMLTQPGEWVRYPIPGALMNSGDAKEILFGFIRTLVNKTGADACIIGTEMWGSKLTPEGMRHKAEVAANVDRGFDRLVKRGWAMRTELLQIVAQTPDEVLLMGHEFRRRASGIEWIGQTWSDSNVQSEYAGRTKMWGEFTPETLGEPPEGSYADKHNRGEQ